MTTAHPRRRTLAAGLALLTAGLTGALVPIGIGTAHAVAPQQTQFLIVDTHDDGYYGLSRRATPDGSLTAVVAESDAIDVELVSSSLDGSRFVDVSTSYDAVGNPLRSRVVVRDVSGRTVQKVEDVDATKFAVFSAALSPSGTLAVWGRYEFATGTLMMRRAAMGSAAVNVIAGTFPATFVDMNTILAYTTTGAAVTMVATGGIRHAVTGLPDDAGTPVLSPDGTKLAWSRLTTPDSSAVDTANIQVAPLTYDAGWHIGTPVTVATGLNNQEPSFVDSTTVAFVRDNGDGGPGATFTAPADGSNTTGTAQGGAVGDVLGQAMGSTDDGVAPGVAALTPATLAGTSATLNWTLPGDADLSGVLITRNSGPAVYVPAFLTTRMDTGLVIGSTYTYGITSVDRSGNLGATATRSLTALLAAPSASDPTSTKHAKAPFTVTFGPSTTGGTFTVSYRSNRSPAYQPWITDTAVASRTFGSAASQGVAATTSLIGTTYQFRAQASDAFGNATPLVTSAQPVVPFDHTKAGFVGGTVVAHGAAWLGSYRVISSTAHKATLSVSGNRLQIVGWRCPSCGVMDVYEGATKIAAIDTRSATTQTRVVLYSRTWGVSGSRTITIKPRGTAGRPNVILDGFAIRGAL